MRNLRSTDIQPLDLILLRGTDPVSRAMLQLHESGSNRGARSNIGLAVTREVLDLPCLEPGRTYLWVSTLKAARNPTTAPDSTPPARKLDAEQLGVLLCDLELLIPLYLSEGGSVTHYPFLGQRPQHEALAQALGALHAEAPHTRLPPAMLETYGALFPELRAPRRPVAGRVAELVDSLLEAARAQPYASLVVQYRLCSEWAAQVYSRLGILELPDPRQAEPVHFLNHADLFGAPQPLLPEGYESGLADDSIPAADSAAALAQHQNLQRQLIEVATSHTASLSVSETQRVDIEFREDDLERLRSAEHLLAEDRALPLSRARAPLAIGDTPPPMNIVIQIAGSRGDVQPFIRIGQRLAEDGHRVRLATHAHFRSFVESNGLEFYPLGGDPREMIGYMVRTGGKVIPTDLGLLINEVPKKRRLVDELINSTWGACTEPDPDTPGAKPFSADAIIANPPSFGHYHLAEKLGVPLHMIFTMPWSPTRTYPHPLANLDFTRRDATENALSYYLIEGLTYSGLSDVIGRFRRRLGLPKISIVRGTDYLNQEAIPYTYLWSPHLLPRPVDWGEHIDIANFIFFDEASDYQPPDELAAFLAAGEPPIYVGFGSIPVQDPVAVTRIVFDALAAAGRRGIVASGWGGLGGIEIPDHVLLINECPHDWLFPRCAAVCHHGGAGTTSTGLRAGKPTIIVAFFGDQFFWGPAVAQAGAGPAPTSIGQLDVKRLAAAFRACADPEMAARAREIGARLRSSDGAALTVRSFYRHLPDSADGAIAYLGFDSSERQRLRAGEIVSRPLEHQHAQGLGQATVARIERPLDALYADLLSGRALEADPWTLAFGELGEQATPADFKGAGFDINETDEIEALLLAHPGGQFNLSQAEHRELAILASGHAAGWTLDKHMIDTINHALTELLCKRYHAYRQGGLDGIEPYARSGGEQTTPGELLRLAVPPDSLLADEFPGFARALLTYPNHSEQLPSRFYWARQNIAGQRSVALLHNLFLPGDNFALVSMRWYYIGRSLDVAQALIVLARQGDATLMISAGKTESPQLAGQLGGRWRRWRTGNSLEDATTRIVEALRQR